MLGRWSWCTLCVAAVGCGPGAQSAPAPVLPAAPRTDPEPASRAAPPEPSPDSSARASAVAITFPEAGTCRLATDRWRGLAVTTELRLAGDGPVFAELSSPRATLHLMSGQAHAGVEADDHGLVLRGYLAEAFALQPAKPFVMGGFLVPTSVANLTWTESQGSEVLVSYDVGPGLELVQTPLSAKVPCVALTIDFARFDAEEAIGAGKNAKDDVLRIGHPLALAREPSGAVVAWLQPEDEQDAAVKVWRSERGKSFISWLRFSDVVFGWIASAELQHRAPPPGPGYGTGHGLPQLQRSSAVIGTARCDHDVAVTAEAAGVRATVGLIRAGTLIELLSRDQTEVAVQTRSRRLAASKDARLLVAAHDLESCSAATP